MGLEVGGARGSWCLPCFYSHGGRPSAPLAVLLEKLAAAVRTWLTVMGGPHSAHFFSSILLTMAAVDGALGGDHTSSHALLWALASSGCPVIIYGVSSSLSAFRMYACAARAPAAVADVAHCRQER